MYVTSGTQYSTNILQLSLQVGHRQESSCLGVLRCALQFFVRAKQVYIVFYVCICVWLNYVNHFMSFYGNPYSDLGYVPPAPRLRPCSQCRLRVALPFFFGTVVLAPVWQPLVTLVFGAALRRIGIAKTSWDECNWHKVIHRGSCAALYAVTAWSDERFSVMACRVETSFGVVRGIRVFCGFVVFE